MGDGALGQRLAQSQVRRQVVPVTYIYLSVN